MTDITIASKPKELVIASCEAPDVPPVPPPPPVAEGAGAEMSLEGPAVAWAPIPPVMGALFWSTFVNMLVSNQFGMTNNMC